MAKGIASQSDGPRLTVNSMVKNPTIIPRRILSMLQNEFIADSLLRKLPPTEAGVYLFDESTPLFAEGDAPIVGEFGEIPVISGRMGARKVAVTVKRALGVRISIEMRNRNSIDKVNTQTTQVKNTFVRTWETAFLNGLLLHPDVHSITAGAAWDAVGAAIREDLVEATAAIENSTLDDSVATEDFFGFSPNTLVIGRSVRDALMLSDDFNKAYVDNLADKSIAYTGKLPGRFFNVDAIMVSREMDRLAPKSAVLLERKTVGGIGDERPLQSTPLYGEGNGPNGGPRESWRSDTVRQSAVVIDQPLAACIIEDVLT
jgi:hypothetical protein